MSHADALKPIAAIEKVAVARRQAESINADVSTLTETSNKRSLTLKSATQPLQLPAEVGSRVLLDILEQFNKVASQELNPEPWTLSSGTVVDDKLISYVQSQRAENAAHSFIFDTSNHDVMRLFTLDEQQEIVKTRHTNLSNDRHLSEYLATFDSQTIQQLRTRLASNDSDAFDHRDSDDRYHLLECRRWIYKTMLGMADLMERSSINGYGVDTQSER